MAKICKSCGAAVEEKDRFCGYCGNNLTEQEAAPVVEAEIIPPPRRYESPAADAREVRERLVGTKTEYYLPRFEKMEALNSFTSWNWAAFLAGVLWMLYRKMYVIGGVLWGVIWVLNLMGIPFLNVMCWVAMGVVGNFLYMKDINNRTEKAMNMQPEEREMFIQKNSGTSWSGVAIGLVVVVLVSVIFSL